VVVVALTIYYHIQLVCCEILHRAPDEFLCGEFCTSLVKYHFRKKDCYFLDVCVCYITRSVDRIGLFEVLFQDLNVGSGENYDNFSKNCRPPSRSMSPGPLRTQDKCWESK